MQRLLSIVLMFILVTPNYSAYIDTRDLTGEALKIQRLLGRLDAMKISPPADQRPSGPNGAQIAMLTMMTSGLAIATASSYSYSHYNRYYRARPYYHNKPYYHKPRGVYYSRNNAGVAVGATMATMGLIGLAASAAAEEAQEKQQQAYQAKLKTIEKDINTIISNLVATDEDYFQEDTQLNQNIATTTDQNIIAISELTSKDILILSNNQAKILADFVDLTNDITTKKYTIEQEINKIQQDNILKMSDPELNKESIKALKALNKELSKQHKKRQKELSAQLKSEIKKFNKTYPSIQEETAENIAILTENRDDSILSEVSRAQNQKEELFQKYIQLYISKLAVY